jgi:hypothetical protein
MNRFIRLLFTLVATVCTTETVYHLSRFKYGEHSVFDQPFDLVSFTVKMLWWFGAWGLFFWLFGRSSKKHLPR